MNLTVRKDRAAQRLGHSRFSLAALVNAVVYPAQNEYADILIKKMQDEFGGGIRYKGGMEKGFGKANLTQSAIGITQSSKYEEHIRSGTQGPYKGGFPSPVVAWAKAKLGASDRLAFAIAKSIQKNGTSEWFQLFYYPYGARGFEYPEWALDETEDDLNRLQKKLGPSVIAWTTTGATWKGTHVG